MRDSRDTKRMYNPYKKTSKETRENVGKTKSKISLTDKNQPSKKRKPWPWTEMNGDIC